MPLTKVTLTMNILKASGAEWNRFYSDENIWTDGVYHDDVLIRVNGKEVENYENLDPHANVEVECGYVDLGQSVVEIIDLFLSWRKSQASEFCTFEAPKELMSEIQAAIESAGGKICHKESKPSDVRDADVNRQRQ
jgi:hypothetical protein